MKTNRILALFLLAAMLCTLCACGILSSSKGPDLEEIYDEYCDSPWAKVGSDGSYLSIDTNPYDEDDNGVAYPKAADAVEDINEALGLPESLWSDMKQTTGSDGKQSETFEQQGVTVSWRYHPDTGLEVTYKKIA